MAMRYLRGAEGRAEGRGFLHFIMYVAIGGVAVGVAALLLALSIVRGFSNEIEQKIVGFGAHVQVQSSFQGVPLEAGVALGRQLAGWEVVHAVRPVVQSVALLRASEEAIDGVILRGTPALPSYLKKHLSQGDAAFGADTTQQPGLVVGAPLAQRLDLSVGDRITLFVLPEVGDASSTHRTSLGRPRLKQFYLTGIYDTALKDFDERYVFTSIDVVRGLLDYPPEAVTRLDLTLGDATRAAEVAARIQKDFGFPIMVVTIYDAFSGLFAWIHLQESITPLVIAVIVIVAAFNIIGTLLMMMVEKTREIGVLESLGASARSVRRLFLMLGLFIGLAGTLLGEALALVLGLLQERYKLIPLPAEAYYMTHAPVELNPLDFAIVGAVALVLCVVAAYIPARVAGRIEPVRAIWFR